MYHHPNYYEGSVPPPPSSPGFVMNGANKRLYQRSPTRLRHHQSFSHHYHHYPSKYHQQQQQHQHDGYYFRWPPQQRQISPLKRHVSNREPQSFESRFTTKKPMAGAAAGALRRPPRVRQRVEPKQQQPFLFQSQFVIEPSQEAKMRERRLGGPEVLVRTQSHGHAEYERPKMDFMKDTVRKSQSFLGATAFSKAKSSSSNNNNKLPVAETAFDIHKLIFESDERIKEMIRQAKEEDELRVQVHHQHHGVDDVNRGSSVETNREFNCNRCGEKNVMKVPRNGNSNSNSNAKAANIIRMSESDKASTKAIMTAKRGLLYRSKSKARFLNSAEQLKLQHFRRFLRASGIGYHDLIERVEMSRRRERDEWRTVVDEDGVPDEAAKRRIRER